MIIGLCGLAGAGKSEVAHALRHFAPFKRIAFADPLKDMLAAIGFSHDQLYGGSKETLIPEIGRTPRFVMQELGTGWGRDTIGEDFWVRMWERKVCAAGCDAMIVADDVRFPNEVAAIKARGGEVWRVERPGLVAGNHASEQQPLDVDRVIPNGSSLAELHSFTSEAFHRATSA